MKRKGNIVILVLILSLTGFFALATGRNWFGLGMNQGGNEERDPKEEIKKLVAKYGKLDTSISLKADILLYDRENKDILKETTPFSYERMKNQAAGQLGYLFTYITDSLSVQVDTVNKMITVSKIIQDVNAGLQKGLTLDQYLSQTGEKELKAIVTESKGIRKLSMESVADPRIKRSTLYYSPVSYLIVKAEIEWWKDAMFMGENEEAKRTWLTVMEYKYQPLSGTSIHDKIKNIIRPENGIFQTTNAYKGYQLIINDSLK
ncbi:MAG: hypothetical protein KA229_03410 [Chitinophagaceae bacterium]|nr:hypothetical protein [Chitinophagaceae bacterium]